jgi:hypothetical protein
MIEQGIVDLRQKQKRLLVGQIASVYNHWRFTVLEKTLGVGEVPKIIAFCDHILQRQVSLFEEYKTQFPNIFKERVAEYFKLPCPAYADSTQRICRTTESPNPHIADPTPLPDEDVEMAEETEPTYARLE